MSSYPSLAFLARSLGFGKGKVHQTHTTVDAGPSRAPPNEPTIPAQHDPHQDESAQKPLHTISVRTVSGRNRVSAAKEERIAPSDDPTTSLDLRQDLPAVDSPGYALARQSAVNKVSYLLVTNQRAVDGQTLQQLYAESFKDSASNELLDALLRTGVDQGPDSNLEDSSHVTSLTAKQRHEWNRRLGVVDSSEGNTGAKNTADASGVNAPATGNPEALISTTADPNVERDTVLQSNSHDAEQPFGFVQNSTSIRSSEDDTDSKQESIIAQKPTVAALPLNSKKEPVIQPRISVPGNKSQSRKADLTQQPSDTPNTPAEQGPLDVRPHSKSRNKYTTTQRRQFKRQRRRELQFKETSSDLGMNGLHADRDKAQLQSRRNLDAGRVKTVLSKEDAEVEAAQRPAQKARRAARKAARRAIKASRVVDRQQDGPSHGEATLTKQQSKINAADRSAGTTSTQSQSNRVVRRKERKLRRQQQRREARDAQRTKKKLPLIEKR